MAVLATSGLSAIPNNIATGIWQKATTGSTVGQLSGSEPQKFGSTNVMTLTGLPRAEYVAEGAQKGSSSATFGTKTITPHKAQVTIRANEEVKWADEDYQLDVLNELGIALGGALARALDLGVYHAINPLTGTAAASITSKITDTTKSVEVAGSADTEVEAAAGLVIAAGFTPSGIALDPKYAWTLATARYSDGRKKYPDLGFGTNITTFEGLNASVSTTVSGTPEATDTTVRGIIGDFSTIRWGVQRSIPVQTIEYGDPDGQGDLKRNNQIALRAEVVYGWAFMDLNAFAKLVDAV
jgi:HK97 family phage major capsid protein